MFNLNKIEIGYGLESNKRPGSCHTMAPTLRRGEQKPVFPGRISSYGPRAVAVLLGLGAVVALTAGLRLLSVSGSVSWPLLVLGILHLGASALCLIVWKQVREGEHHYYVSDLFKSEAIRLDEVCALIDAPGLLWNSARIHFRRKTRFGWAISYVPMRRAGKPTGHHAFTARVGLFGRYWATCSNPWR